MLLMIDNYDSFTFNLVQYFGELGEDVRVVRNDEIDVAGIAATMQGRRDAQIVRIDPRLDGRGNPYYWIAFGRNNVAVRPGTDLEALAQRRISVTPLQLDFTDEEALETLAAALGE